MRSKGDEVVARMLSSWLAVHPIRRASIRWQCEVRVHRRNRATVIAHKPGVMHACRQSQDGPDAA